MANLRVNLKIKSNDFQSDIRYIQFSLERISCRSDIITVISNQIIDARTRTVDA